jgi:hypothetical protein
MKNLGRQKIFMYKKIFRFLAVIIICIILILSVVVLSTDNTDISFSSDIPDDFEFFIYSGGFDFWSPIYLFYTDNTGDAYYYTLEPEDRITGDFTLASNFYISDDEMNNIWDTIIDNDFFNLDSFHSRESVLDGTFANITVKADGLIHSVTTVNIDNDRFDNIIRIVNSLTPEELDLYYDALLNHEPLKPGNITGIESGKLRNEYSYTTVGFDEDDDDIYFLFDWGDSSDSGWQGPYKSGENITLTHSWNQRGDYNIKVKSIDDPNGDGDLIDGIESEWSNSFAISMPKSIEIKKIFIERLIENIIGRFQFLENILIKPETTEIIFRSSALNNDGYDDKSGTRGKIEGCKITIEIHIVIYGSWVNQASAQDIKTMEDKITNDIEDKWNRDEWDKDGDGQPDGEDPWRVQCKEDCTLKEPGCTVKIDAKVYVKKDATGGDLPTGGQAKPGWQGYHWIRLADPRTPEGANVLAWDNKLPKPNNGMETTGVFNVNDFVGVYAHEAGHLMGLGDQYEPVDLDIPLGDGEELTITINLPKEGKVGNIMADPSGWPSQEDINNVVESSGIECPCECCPEEEDNKKPVVTPTSPSNNTVISFSQPVIIIGYATDDLSGVVELDYILTWDGGLFEGNSNTIDPPENYVQFSLGPFIPDNYIDLDDEWLTVTIYATDLAGNTGSASVTIIREDEQDDNTPPVTDIIIGEPNEDGGYSIWPVTPIFFESTDDFSGVNYIHYDIWWDSDNDMMIDTQMASETIYGDAATFTIVEYGILYGLIELKWYAVDNANNFEDIQSQEHFVIEGLL